MKKYITALAVLFIVDLSMPLVAQDSTMTPNPVFGRVLAFSKTEWIVGIHGTAIDDDGQWFKDLFAVSKSWNYLPYPTRATVEKRIKDDLSVEAALTYSKYKAGKNINDYIMPTSNPFFAIDFNGKYYLGGLIGRNKYFDPYGLVGVGFTARPALTRTKSTPTGNFGLGCNFWLYKGFGLNIQTTAKVKILPKSSNYLQHSIGVVYQIGFIDNADPKEGAIRGAL
jgi:hypothetical protein